MLHAHNTIENKNYLIDDTIVKIEPFFGKVNFLLMKYSNVHICIFKEYEKINSESINISYEYINSFVGIITKNDYKYYKTIQN